MNTFKIYIYEKTPKGGVLLQEREKPLRLNHNIVIEGRYYGERA